MVSRCLLFVMPTPHENLQHKIFSVVMDVGISLLDVINSCWTISDKVSCFHDHSYPTAADSNHLSVNGHLRWHSRPLQH